MCGMKAGSRTGERSPRAGRPARRAGAASLVCALANERLAMKPKSPLARRYRDQGAKQAA